MGLTIHPTKGIIRKLKRQVSHKVISFQEKNIFGSEAGCGQRS